MRWTANDIKRSKVSTRNSGIKGAKKKNTRGNVKVELQGIKFDSIREKDRYIELGRLQKLGIIYDLKLQVPFELNEGGTHSLKYIADFTYTLSSGESIVEDVKGFQTAVFKKKMKLMKKVHGITIKLT